jgi:GalNAc-alpha-(1->4)-GalNAc-alpha-(1->3)-diNAcBac-PP-undecaprenol alpha-1,4-N-acetyl-D-galactosaminyltransferase
MTRSRRADGPRRYTVSRRASGRVAVRLTLVVSSLGPGGAERVVATLANAWARRGCAVTLLTLDDGTRPPFYLLDPLIRHIPLARTAVSHGWTEGLARNLGRIRVLRRAIRASRPDAVLSFTDTTNVLTLCASRLSRWPVVASEHSDPERQPLPAAWKRLMLVSYRWAAAIVTPNRETLAWFPPGVRARMHVIPNPVLAGVAAPGAVGERGGRLIVSIGRLSEEKGHDRLLEAFAGVAAARPGWRLLIAGDGPLRGEIEALRDRLGLRERVDLPGLVQNVDRLLAQADLYVLASRREVFPMALCEAMASGVPAVVMEYLPGVREIVRDGVDGVVVRAGDVPALAAAMARLMDDPPERRRLGARAVEVVQRYGVDRVLGLWDELLDGLEPPATVAAPDPGRPAERGPAP